MFIVVDFVIDSVRKLLDTPSYITIQYMKCPRGHLATTGAALTGLHLTRQSVLKCDAGLHTYSSLSLSLSLSLSPATPLSCPVFQLLLEATCNLNRRW